MKIGIVIPTYWRKDGSTKTILNRALLSVAQQTHTNYKIFLIGDKYEVPNELSALARVIPSSKISVTNLKIAKERSIYTGHRLWCTGGVNATNTGIEMAISENIFHICHLDHDDWWEPTHLEEIVKAFKEKDYAIVASQSLHINKQILPKNKLDPFYPVCSDLVHSAVCINFNLLNFRYRNVFQETGKDFPSDCDLWNRLSEHMKKNKLIGKLITKTTCNHLVEGDVKK